MLGICKFLAFLALFAQANCFLGPLANLLMDMPSIMPFGDDIQESKMMLAVNQVTPNDLDEQERMAMGLMPHLMMNQQNQQLMQEQQMKPQGMDKMHQQQMKPQSMDMMQQQQQMKPQSMDMMKPQSMDMMQQQQQMKPQSMDMMKPQSMDMMQQEQQHQQMQMQPQMFGQDMQQQQKQQQQQQQPQQSQREMRRIQRNKNKQQQQKQQQHQLEEQGKIEILAGTTMMQQQPQLQQQNEDVYMNLKNEEIIRDFADLQKRINYIRDKLIRTIEMTRMLVENQQRQADDKHQQLMQEQQRLQQLLQQLEQQRLQQQQQQPMQDQMQMQQQQQQERMMAKPEMITMLRSRPMMSSNQMMGRMMDDDMSDLQIMRRSMMDTMMPSMPIMSMKIDAVDQQMGPFALLNSIMSSPFLPLVRSTSTQSCDLIHGKNDEAQRENRIRIQHTFIKQMTYRFESSTCQCSHQQQQQQMMQQQQQQQMMQQQQPAMMMTHCSLSYSRPDQQTCKLTEMRSPMAGMNTMTNCEAMEMCRMSQSQCDGIYHDGTKFFMVECKQPAQRMLTRPGLGSEYMIQMKSCF